MMTMSLKQDEDAVKRKMHNNTHTLLTELLGLTVQIIFHIKRVSMTAGRDASELSSVLSDEGANAVFHWWTGFLNQPVTPVSENLTQL